MKLLAIETATECCSVALGNGVEAIERFEQQARRQTELVLPMVESLLAEAEWRLEELDAIAFSRGPGAFTGVRVSVSVAQGLGYAANVPLIGLSTLAVCAVTAALAHGHGRWLVAQDARMGELYLGGFETSVQNVQAVFAERVSHPGQLPVLEGEWRGTGSGGEYLDAVRRAAPGLREWVGPVSPRAAAMLPMAQYALQRKEAVSAAEARPVYLRNQVIQGAVR